MSDQVYAAGDETPPNTKVVSGYNNTGGTLVAFSTVVWDTAVADGKGFRLPVTAMGGVVAGVLQEDVAEGADTDKIMRQGVTDAFVEGTADITIGDSLKPVDGQRYLVQDAAGAVESAVQAFTAWEAYSSDSEGTKSVYVNLP